MRSGDAVDRENGIRDDRTDRIAVGGTDFGHQGVIAARTLQCLDIRDVLELAGRLDVAPALDLDADQGDRPA